MDGTADDRYFEWLYSHIGPVDQRTSRQTFWSLARQMYRTEFTWKIGRDRNRAEHGCQLRDEFADRWGHEGLDPNWMSLPCSFLEMTLALSYHLAYESYGEAHDWFWKLMSNTGLSRYNDRRFDEGEVRHIIDRVMGRYYNSDGSGGFFPLVHPRQDQREVELWYQKEAYLLEGHSISNGPVVA